MKVRMRLTMHISDYTLEEKDACWNSFEDNIKMMNDVQCTVLRNAQLDTRDVIYKEEDTRQLWTIRLVNNNSDKGDALSDISDDLSSHSRKRTSTKLSNNSLTRSRIVLAQLKRVKLESTMSPKYVSFDQKVRSHLLIGKIRYL
jgi:PBP1b-binding outer membrane lipoprotein LpoB